MVENTECQFRVIAVNEAGAGEPSEPTELVFIRDPLRKRSS